MVYVQGGAENVKKSECRAAAEVAHGAVSAACPVKEYESSKPARQAKDA